MKQIFTDDKKKCILGQFIVINVIINQVYILVRQMTYYDRKNQILADIWFCWTRASVTCFGVHQYFDFVINSETAMSRKYVAQHGRSISKIISEVVGSSILPYPEYNEQYFHETQQLKQKLLKQTLLTEYNLKLY